MQTPSESAPHPGALCKTHLVYEMSCAEYLALRGRAAGHCEVCGIAEEETPHGRLFIDHDKTYGNSAVRGLLCSRCNTHLGMLEDPQLHPGFDRSERAQGLRQYLGNAWFMQIVRSARVNGIGLAATSADQRDLIAATHRNAVTRAVTRRLSMGPTIQISVHALSGPLAIHTRASYRPLSGEALVLHFEAVGNRKVEYRTVSIETNRKPARTQVEVHATWQEAVASLRL